jgi:TonB-linked SusC/RagA family outer membrane protein
MKKTKNYFLKYWIKKNTYLFAILYISMGNSLIYANESEVYTTDIKVNSNIIQKVISGKVNDAQGMPIPGVTIMIKGSKQGTYSDLDGNYNIDAGDKDILVFTYIGFVTKEIPVNGKSQILVTLVEDIAQLNEVVVIGYGTQTKKNITGSVSVINGDDIVARSTTNVSNALQGAVAGVSVTRGSSAPGSGNTILIRGITTIQGDSSPLILVDDVPVASINDVNADQIESISILKDGASAAIYGSRAAAGVIIITTKKGKTGVFNANYSTEYVINKPTQIRKNVGAVRYMEMYNETIFNDNKNLSNEFSTYDPNIIAGYDQLHQQDPDNYPDTDWRSLILNKQSETKRHSLTLSGGTDKLKTNASFGYEEQNALYNNRNWTRYTGRINNEIKLSEKFGAILNIAFKQTDEDQPNIDPTNIAISAAPVFSALWADGRLADGKTGYNPYAQLLYGGSQKINNTLVYGKFGVYLKPFSDLKISVNAAPNYEFTRYKKFNNSIKYWGADDPEMLQAPQYITGNAPINRTLNENRVSEKSLTTQLLLDYNKSIGNHNISGVFGLEQYSKETEALRVIGTEFVFNDYPYLNQAPTDKVFDNGTGISEVAYRSLFSRVSYDYDKKYFIQGTIRRDGSSRFGSDYRWGVFPSVALSWVVSNEKFMKSITAIDLLKFRVSYGELGNDRLGNYLYISSLQFADVLLANGATVNAAKSAAQRYLDVADITWETTTSKNIGMDVTVLKNRLSVTADYFNKETTNMLLNLSIPDISGFDDPVVNVGSMNNKGWEVTVNWKDRISDLKYSISANAFDSKSKIGNIGGKRLFNGNKLSEQGIEYESWFGYKSDGIYQTLEEVNNSAVTSTAVAPGDIKYKDLSGPDGVPDGKINELDKTVLGGSLPRYQYGGNINLEYKSFDFGLSFQGVGLQKFYLNPGTYATAFQDNWLSPPQLIDNNYWSYYNSTEENAAVQYPRIGNKNRANNNAFSDFWLNNGSYLRIKNITLGYSLPSQVTSKLQIAKIRLYLSANDLFTFDHLPNGVDPEQSSEYLITKSFIFGLKINF